MYDIAGTGLSTAEFGSRLKAAGVLMNEAARPGEMRAVTHFDVTREECGRAAEIVGEVVRAGAGRRIVAAD